MNEDSVTIEWQGTGPGADATLGYVCQLRGVTDFEPCMLVEECGYMSL